MARAVAVPERSTGWCWLLVAMPLNAPKKPLPQQATPPARSIAQPCKLPRVMAEAARSPDAPPKPSTA